MYAIFEMFGTDRPRGLIKNPLNEHPALIFL